MADEEVKKVHSELISIQDLERQSVLSQSKSWVHILYLFTCSELVTCVIPWSAFGIIVRLSGSPLTNSTTPDTLIETLKCIPRTVLWVWLQCLAFTVSNQRLPDSIKEDSINKSWRPLPSGMITEAHTQRLLLAIVPTVAAASVFLGAREVTLLSLLLDWMYNDLNGSDENFVFRHLLNSAGLTCWGLGAAIVACGSLSTTGHLWGLTIGAIVFTTIQLMDLRDQEGDLLRRRITMPLALGETITRWATVMSLIAWSILCPAIWSLGSVESLLPILIGILISARVLLLRTPLADHLSWKLWGPWMFTIFLLPLSAKLRQLPNSIILRSLQDFNH